MKVKLINKYGTWREVADLARTTVGKEAGSKEPSSEWKAKMLLAEHSPIRHLKFRFKIIDIPSWVSVHLVRHKIGVEHYVKTQRTDRTGIDRNKLYQNALVKHEIICNAQSLINISRKRLCNNTAKETREVWKSLLLTIKDIEPELYNACVPECEYRGQCTEFYKCGKK